MTTATNLPLSPLQLLGTPTAAHHDQLWCLHLISSVNSGPGSHYVQYKESPVKSCAPHFDICIRVRDHVTEPHAAGRGHRIVKEMASSAHKCARMTILRSNLVRLKPAGSSMSLPPNHLSWPQRGSSAKPNSQSSMPPVTGYHRTALDQQQANSHPPKSRIEARPFRGAGMAAFPVISATS